MKYLFGFVIGLLMLSSAAAALECIEIKTAAMNPATRECTYFSNACDVPTGWQVLSYCPNDDVDFFTLNKYLPSLALIVGSLLGFLFLTFFLKRLLVSYDGGEQSSASVSIAASLKTFLGNVFRWFGRRFSSLHHRTFSARMKQAFEQKHRADYRKEISTIAEAIHPQSPPKETGTVPVRSSLKELDSIAKAQSESKTTGTNWHEFKNALKNLETIEKKRKDRA